MTKGLFEIAPDQEARSVGLERLKVDGVVSVVDKADTDFARFLKANETRAKKLLHVEHVAANQAWSGFA